MLQICYSRNLEYSEKWHVCKMDHQIMKDQQKKAFTYITSDEKQGFKIEFKITEKGSSCLQTQAITAENTTTCTSQFKTEKNRTPNRFYLPHTTYVFFSRLTFSVSYHSFIFSSYLGFLSHTIDSTLCIIKEVMSRG